MTRATPRSRCALIALLGAAWCSAASSAAAHFPIARAVALEPGGGTAAAVALPGFGIVMRRDAGEPFAYICDALIGLEQSDTPPPMTFLADGSLLIGTSTGLRSVSADGCPRGSFGGELESLPVEALAAHPGVSKLVYAVTGGGAPRVARSTDGGASWELRATLATNDPVTSLVLYEADPNVVYVSQSARGGGATLYVSEDGGTSLSRFNEGDGLSLLEVEARGPGDAGAGRLWAVGRNHAKPGIFDVFRASAPAGPWTSVLTVNYFGGFARDPKGVLWVGDEGGGVYRSDDGGASFNDVAPTAGVACLDFAEGSLFACTPGLTQQSALVQWNDDKQAFDGVVALANVGQMVACDAPTDVQTTCAAAWFEWQRDVIGLLPSSTDAGTRDAGTRDAGTTPVVERAAMASGGCSVSGLRASGEPLRSPPSSPGAYLLGLLLLGANARRCRSSPLKRATRSVP